MINITHHPQNLTKITLISSLSLQYFYRQIQLHLGYSAGSITEMAAQT